MKLWVRSIIATAACVTVLIGVGMPVHSEDAAVPIQTVPLPAPERNNDTFSAQPGLNKAPPVDSAVTSSTSSPAANVLPQGTLPQPESGALTSGIASLAPPASEVALPDSLTLIAKPALIIHGKSDWEQAYKEIRSAVDRGTSESIKSGLTITGYPLCLFVETSDSGFTYDVMLPLNSKPSSQPPSLPLDMRLGVTPEGKALRFTHLAAYDDIDGTYEQITAYLDAKDIVAKDSFIEEYLSFGETSASSTTTVNIFVQPKN